MAHRHKDYDEHHEEVDPLRAYILVFVALMVLLALTLVAYEIPFEKIPPKGTFDFMNTAIALTIATIKALLVMLVFMHLRHSTRLTWVIASAGFIWLFIMISFTFSDYLSRHAIIEGVKEPHTPPGMSMPHEPEH
ncbi:MAG TPA: cytochrome C oxidase subunit IV family protein [Tepidisphaeraceae bacterium]|nr:cytochrome C oxidase subunit IV family protein [Tepidisphaeraceae bacterium]